MKKLFVIVAVIVMVSIGWHYRYAFLTLSKALPGVAGSPFIEKLVEDISTPVPLRGSMEEKSVTLTTSGVIAWTNNQRRQNGSLPGLKENSKLNKAAEAKVKDMFDQQYFEHESPEGNGPGDLARNANYAFLSIGENLALGNFDDDQALVQAWMDSPGHRANIVSTKYTEIGVAVGRGIYEGRQVWLAVQEFGRPASECPAIEPGLQALIAKHKAELAADEALIKQKKAGLEASNPKTKEEVDAYNEDVRVYNEMVKAYNAKLESLKGEISTYNTEVKSYNACLQS